RASEAGRILRRPVVERLLRADGPYGPAGAPDRGRGRPDDGRPPRAHPARPVRALPDRVRVLRRLRRPDIRAGQRLAPPDPDLRGRPALLPALPRRPHDRPLAETRPDVALARGRAPRVILPACAPSGCMESETSVSTMFPRRREPALARSS